MPGRRQMPRTAAPVDSSRGGRRRHAERRALVARADAVSSAEPREDKTPSPRANRGGDPATPNKVSRPSLSKDFDDDDGKYTSAAPTPSAVATPIAPPPGLELVKRCRPDADPFPLDADDPEGDAADAGGDDSPEAARCRPAKASGSSVDARDARILQRLTEALKSKEASASADAEGFVPITKLMRLRPDLQRETFGSTRAVMSAVDKQPGMGLRLDKGHRRIRLPTAEELVRAIAEEKVEESAKGTVPLQALLASPRLAERLRSQKDASRFVQVALEHGDSAVMVRSCAVVRRPRELQLRRLAEDLFSDVRLAHDSRLRSKIAENPSGAVPLTWLCARYMDRLETLTPPQAQPPSQQRQEKQQGSGARAVEEAAAELCEALRSSGMLGVDPRRLTVWRRQPFRAPDATGPPAAASSGASGGKEARVAAQLRQLLDFYFEPFTLQHNRYLLDLLARQVGPPEPRGPWVAEALLGFHCSFQDLLGLGRIASALSKAKLGPEALCIGCDVGDSPSEGGASGELSAMKHLRVNDGGRLHLLTPMEVRSFVTAPGAPAELAGATIRYLAAAREQRGQAPDGVISVVSYGVGEVLAEVAIDGQSREARVKRQLLMHHADVVCLQGLDTEAPRGETLATTLSEDGYGFTCARASPGGGGEANCIFWDRSRWERCGGAGCGAAIAIDLRLIEDPATVVRVACSRPALDLGGSDGGGGGLRGLLDVADGVPAVFCGDLTLLGGADGAVILEPLAGMASVAEDVLGEEIAAPVPAAEGSTSPMRSASNGLNALRRPDAMLYRGLSPVVALSGHTEGYLATMAGDEVAKQFPAFRLPLVAAFDWVHAGARPSDEDRRPAASTVHI